MEDGQVGEAVYGVAVEDVPVQIRTEDGSRSGVGRHEQFTIMLQAFLRELLVGDPGEDVPHEVAPVHLLDAVHARQVDEQPVTGGDGSIHFLPAHREHGQLCRVGGVGDLRQFVLVGRSHQYQACILYPIREITR